MRKQAKAGLMEAGARGRNGSRPEALTEHPLKMAVRMPAAPDVSGQQVAEHFGVARSALHRLLRNVLR